MKDTRDVIGLNVFSTQEGRILGRTTECVVDLATGKVLGLVVAVASGEERGIARADITAVGKDAVMVASDRLVKALGDVAGLEEHRTVGKAPRVLTRAGEVLGSLGVVRVDEACKAVESFEIVGDVIQALADGPATLPFTKGTVHGRDAIVLPEAAEKAIKRPGGLRASFEKALGAVKERAGEMGDRLSDAAKKARTAGEAAGEKALAKAKDAAKRARAAGEAAGGKAVAKAKDIAQDAKEAVEHQVEAVRGKPEPAKKAPAKKAAAKKAPAKKAAKKSS
ncbi:MAG: hypothetical protein FJX74_12905 [Armatimonadetes bacterium]|nr:hypothetical protein [Armatimonadota bacterium]